MSDCTTKVGEKLSDDAVCVAVEALLTETLFSLLVAVVLMETSHEVPIVVVTCSFETELDAGETDVVFVVLGALGDAVVTDEDTTIVGEGEAIEQN